MITKYEQEAERRYPQKNFKGETDYYAVPRQHAFIAGAEFAAPKWISVTDRVPEIPEHCWRTEEMLLFADENGKVHAGYYGKSDGVHVGANMEPAFLAYGSDPEPATHWMKLPEPPNT